MESKCVYMVRKGVIDHDNNIHKKESENRCKNGRHRHSSISVCLTLAIARTQSNRLVSPGVDRECRTRSLCLP